MLKLNYFKNVRSPRCLDYITITDYIQKIKSGYEIEKIQEARESGKGQVYDRIKLNRSCVSFNFLFKDSKENKNIQASTGLLYFDIDGIGLDELYKLDFTKVYIAHKSFGGKGTSIIVKASGINPDNFKDACLYIAAELGIADVIDMNAMKMVQSTVLSYDPDTYTNDDAYIFSMEEKVSFHRELRRQEGISTKNEKVSFREELRREEGISPMNDTFLKSQYSGPLRNSNAGDNVPEGLDYKVFPERINTAHVIIPRNIKEGNRTNVLIAQLNNLLALNPSMTYKQVLERAFQLHHINTNNRLNFGEVEKIVKSVWGYKVDGTLKPIYNKPRTVIFHPTCKLSKEEKIGIVNVEVGKIRSNKTKLRIQEAIETWDVQEKITIKAVAVKLDMSEVTVKRYWASFKEQAKRIKLQQRCSKASIIHIDTVVESEVQPTIEEGIPSTDRFSSVYELAVFVKSSFPLKYSPEGVKGIFDFFRTEQLPCRKPMFVGFLKLNISHVGNFSII